MSISWFSLDVDARDPAELARFWAEVLDYKVVWEEHAYVAIAKDDRTHAGLTLIVCTEPRLERTGCTWTSIPPT